MSQVNQYKHKFIYFLVITKKNRPKTSYQHCLNVTVLNNNS